MDVIVTILMLILFIILLVFVFSVGLMTPVIGKRNIFFVIFIGFMVGVIGGTFFILPVYDNIPQIARGFYESLSSSPETVYVDLSHDINIAEFTRDVKNIEGVEDVKVEYGLLKTDNFTSERGELIEKGIPFIDSNVTYCSVDPRGTIIFKVKGGDPQATIDRISDWLIITSEIYTKYSIIRVSIHTHANKIENLREYLSSKGIAIASIEGPVEENIKGFRASMPPKSAVVVSCGFIGMLAGLAGIFIDSIMAFLSAIKRKLGR
ncbi:MAG TPA: hypothetical protein GXX31_01760 [Methanothermobacter sp.]|uniref:Uncharacterized protein n=1 Tax=Methanothermobacter tenebrarum TaxID=680118 RepID=A0ABM7YD33_9EURY|nr:hypothetical protein [Methanothermobacter tenebrarum]MDI6881650.1 hypothetical protein [Methanothermobacter sp.]BDH79378.1 hypothetical protein MTTB_07570 [Methanothermobacter tenebrarum]HHW16100.1 hypothetical protein [Methanothermobacter sp.]